MEPTTTMRWEENETMARFRIEGRMKALDGSEKRGTRQWRRRLDRDPRKSLDVSRDRDEGW